MDRQTIIIIAICVLAMLLGPRLINKMFPPVPLPPGQTNVVNTATSPGTNQASQASATTSAVPAATTTGTTTVTTPPTAVQYLGAEQLIEVTNATARYIFTSHGGGLKTIELLRFPETVLRHATTTNEFATLNTPHAAPVLTISGDSSVQDAGAFTLTPTANGVRAEKTLKSGLHLVKNFEIGTNYLVHTTVRLENTTTNPLALAQQEWVVGTSTPMGPDDRADWQGVMWFNGDKTDERLRSWFDNRGFLFWGGTPRTEFRAGQSNVVWAAPHNQFFALVAMPTVPALEMVSRPLDLPRPSFGWASYTNNPNPKGLQTALIYPAATIAPGQAIEREINFYAGPKEYRTLAQVGARFGNRADLVMNFGWVGFVSKALLRSMNWLHHSFGLSYGLAIIAITIIIKGIFWPVTQAQSRMSRRMAALQPQMKVLQEKYKDDPLKMQKKMSEFWKEHKINPAAGCLPMLIQLPIFFGFFTMIRSAIELRGASFLWVADLSKSDTLFVIPGINFIPLISTPEGLPFNLLPLLMGATMLWQSHLTPPSPGMDPAQQKMMKYLPAIFIIFLYNYSAGLALYWTVNNLLSVLQTKLIKLDTPASPGTPAAATATALTPASKKHK